MSASPDPHAPSPIASTLTPAQRTELWSRARTIARHLTAMRDTLRSQGANLTPEDAATLRDVQAVYARVSYMQATYSRDRTP